MRDIFFVIFLAGFLSLGIRRPYLFVLGYVYIDIVAPQRLSYYLLNSIPISLIVFGLAMLGFIFSDDKRKVSIAPRQIAMFLLLIYCMYTTSVADFPIDAQGKWDWVWKALVFAIFLPFTLTSKLRIEALALFMVLCASTLIVAGGVKTVLSGGGYGVLKLLVDDNSGLYEGSIISTVSICIIPVILWLAKYGTIFKPDWRVRTYAYALVGACLLIPIGTQARTGLICIGVLAVLMMRFTQYRFVYAGLLAFAGLMAIPFLPQSFTERMETIGNYQQDQSASTRVAVWLWTIDYARQNPIGGGFESYRQNTIRLDNIDVTRAGETGPQVLGKVEDSGRAFHSSYFEMLGEQGYPGLALWLFIHFGGIWRMEWLRRRYLQRNRADEEWVAPLALALQNGQIVFMVGSLFVGAAFQPFVYMMVALQIGLDTYLARRRKQAAWTSLSKSAPQKRLKPSATAGAARPEKA